MTFVVQYYNDVGEGIILMVDLGIQITSDSCSFAQQICVNVQFPDVDLGCLNLVPAWKIWVSSSDGENRIKKVKVVISALAAFSNGTESSQLESEKLPLSLMLK